MSTPSHAKHVPRRVCAPRSREPAARSRCPVHRRSPALNRSRMIFSTALRRCWLCAGAGAVSGCNWSIVTRLAMWAVGRGRATRPLDAVDVEVDACRRRRERSIPLKSAANWLPDDVDESYSCRPGEGRIAPPVLLTTRVTPVASAGSLIPSPEPARDGATWVTNQPQSLVEPVRPVISLDLRARTQGPATTDQSWRKLMCRPSTG